MPVRRTVSRYSKRTRSKLSTFVEKCSASSSTDVSISYGKKKRTKTQDNVSSSLQTSTPKEVKNTKNGIKKIESFKETLIKQMQEKMDDYEKDVALFKLTSFSIEFLNTPLSALTSYRDELAIEHIEESEQALNTRRSSKRNRVNSGSSFKAPKPVHSRRTKKRSALMRTPLQNPTTPVAPITPKVDMNIPLTVLRQPRLGEAAVSMSGSPLLVSSCIPSENSASVTVPLSDGKIMTILPRGGFTRNLLPHLASETKCELETLYKHLGILFDGNSEEDDDDDDYL